MGAEPKQSYFMNIYYRTIAKAYRDPIMVMSVIPYAVLVVVFGAIFIFVDQETMIAFANWTAPIFDYTSIAHAYGASGNRNFLYYWAYVLCFFPLCIFHWFNVFMCMEVASAATIRKDLTPRLALVGLGFCTVAMWFILGTESVYLGQTSRPKLQFFPPTLFGVFSFAFYGWVFEFFGILPALFILSRIFNWSFRRAR